MTASVAATFTICRLLSFIPLSSSGLRRRPTGMPSPRRAASQGAFIIPQFLDKSNGCNRPPSAHTAFILIRITRPIDLLQPSKSELVMAVFRILTDFRNVVYLVMVKGI